MGIDMVTINFYLRVPPLWDQYLKKGTFLEAEIFSVFLSHLGLHMSKVSSKSLRSIEHVFYQIGRPFRALTLKYWYP